MNGLYQRALEVYKQGKGLHLVSRGEADRGMEDIPEAERENILHEIDGLLASNRVVAGAPAPQNGKSGVLLPFAVNIIIVVAVATAIFLYTKASNGEEVQLASGARAIKGAESQVVEALRQESAAQLGQKDQAIVEFQKKLDDAQAERDRLKNETAEAIRKRESELSSEMTASLEAERQRLRNAGLGTAQADEKLKLLEEKLKAETAKQVAAFQKKAEEDAAQRAAAADGLVAEYQRSLGQAQAERSKLQQQYQSREAELKSQYATDAKALQEEKAKALSDLNRIQELQRQESLVEGRILASYDEINARIIAGKYAAALESLGVLRDSLDREPAASLASIQKRRPVELFILSSLEELVHNRIEREGGDAAALIDAKTRLGAVRQKSSQADLEYLRKNYPAAKELYLSALSEIPEARSSHDRIEAMDLEEQSVRLTSKWKADQEAREARLAAGWKLDQEAREARLIADLKAERDASLLSQHESQLRTQREKLRSASQELVAAGESLSRDGQWQATLDRYREALGLLLENKAAADSLVDQLSQAGYRIGAEKDAARRAALPERIAAVRRELAQAPTAAKAGGDDSADPEFASLLGAKILLWQIIGTEPIKSEYPELYDTMQRYFDAFASQQRQAGREEALREVLELAESLGKGASSAPTAARNAPASERETMLMLLGDLEEFLRE